MAWDFKFSPTTRDLIRDDAGSVERTHSADTMVMHQLAIRYRSWWGGPELGTTLGNLKRFGRNPELSILAEAKRALEVVQKRGRISNLQVKTEAPNQGRVNLATQFQDVRMGRVTKTSLPVGG